MKNIKIIALAVLIGAISYSCNKLKQIDPVIPDPEGNTMKDLVVPAGFNWQTITDYNFYITGGSGEVIRITSEDESLIYHKGTYIEENGNYKVELRLPSFLTTVKINSVSVDLVGGNINYDLSTKASVVKMGTDTDNDGVEDILDDYVDDPLRAYDNFYPDNVTKGTVAFEDLWPGTGDYDFNDLVIGYQFRTVTDADNNVREIRAYFEVRAHGAVLNNAFGFQLPNAEDGEDGDDILSNVIVTGLSYTTSTLVQLTPYNFELGQTHPVIIVMDQVSDLMPRWENTEIWKPKLPYVPISITLTVPLSKHFKQNAFKMWLWDPFMIINQDRDIEVHLIDRPNTIKANQAPYFGTGDDASDPGNNLYYRTENGLPWALEFLTAFEWPKEKCDITWAYLHFKAWAEGDGQTYTDWYLSTVDGYREDSNIY